MGLRESLEDTTPAKQLNNNSVVTELSSTATEISQYNLFNEIPYQLLEPVLAECSVRQLQKDDILISPGQENHNLYLLISGQLQVYLDKVDSHISFPIARGECIGEMSLIEGRLTSAFVIAEEESSLIVVPEDIFWNKFIHLPNATRNLLRVLTNRTRKDNEVIRQSLEQQLRHEHLQKELKAAGNIQANILPQEIPLLPNHPQIDLCAMMEPAIEVGGDFYDAFALDKNTICIAVGDVSGKGMPAALFMMRVITLLRMSLSKDTSFESVLPTVNRMLCVNNDECMFVTMFVGLFDVTSGTLTYTNAGHNPPLFSSNGGPFELMDVPKGILLGVNEEARYGVAKRILQPGDTLVLYTDGVTEAENPQHEFYSLARLCNTLQTVSTDDDITMVIKVLSDSVSHFSKGMPQSDDITILALRYRGNEII
jgi:sigma-B regulation protein RsbU (phosphoserine phosphatase)